MFRGMPCRSLRLLHEGGAEGARSVPSAPPSTPWQRKGAPRKIRRAPSLLQEAGWIKAPPHNSAARRAMSFPPSAACKFLDLPPVNLRNFHLHPTKNPFAGRPPHLCGVALIVRRVPLVGFLGEDRAAAVHPLFDIGIVVVHVQLALNDLQPGLIAVGEQLAHIGGLGGQ